MNRSLLVAATVAVAVAAFVAAALFIPRESETPELAATSIDVEETGASASLDVASEAAPSQTVRLVRDHSPIIGDPNAPVTVVEFFDPACEACRAFHPTVKALVADNPCAVRVVVRYTPFHGEASETAIALLEAARAQDMFEPVLEALLDRQPEWASHGAPDPQRLFGIARDAGLDVETARTWMMSPMVVGVINADRQDVEAIGVSQTPTFFVDGSPLEEFGRQELVETVERAVAAANAG